MIEGLHERKYVQTSKKKTAPISLILALAIFGLVVVVSVGTGRARLLLDAKGALIVLGGTLASLIFQFDLMVLVKSIATVLRSFGGTPDRLVQKSMRDLDKAIIGGFTLTEIRKSDGLSGEIISDVIYMYQEGLTYDEIDAFVTGRVQDEFFEREMATSMLQKASIVAPSFGLFGTVIGLVQVMQSMSSPGQIGPAMSLALMTTAYGSGLASLVFSPLAGRLEHHNSVFLECHKQLLTKIGILIKRDDNSMDTVRDGAAA
jgi:chemotaxis protein MotA